MIHFCLCGGHEGQLSPDKKFYVTIFGACELKRPTLAKQIIDMRRRAEAGLPQSSSHFFVTICGATEIKSPTLAEEYLDYKDAIASNMFTPEEWHAAVARFSGDDAMRIDSFTLCGAFSANELPSENEEVEGLALNRHLGHIPDHAGTMLEMAVGQAGSQRASLIGRAFASTVASPA